MERIKNYVILVLVLALGLVLYWNSDSDDDLVIDPVTIDVPGFDGSTGVIPVDSTEVEVDTVYLPGSVETKLIVDKEYKEKYEQAIAEKDSVEAKLLYLESIRIREYNKVAVDNDSIKIDLYAKTRGSLLAYKIDYNVKDQTFEYTPEVVHVRPKLTLLTGVELGVSPLGQEPSIKFDAYFQGQKGHMWGVGINTQGHYFVGYKHSINLRRLNPFIKKK